jgi:hypothetical protein
VKVVVLNHGGGPVEHIAAALAELRRSVVFGASRSCRNLQLEELHDHMHHTGPLTMSELTAALPPSDDPFKPCRRSKGEKARNRKQRRG